MYGVRYVYEFVCFLNLYIRRKLVEIHLGTVLPLPSFFGQECALSRDLLK